MVLLKSNKPYSSWQRAAADSILSFADVECKIRRIPVVTTLTRVTVLSPKPTSCFVKVSIKTCVAPSFLSTEQLDEEKNVFVPQKYVLCSIKSPEGQVINNCPLSCSQLVVTISDMPMMGQEVGNVPHIPLQPPVASRIPTCTSSDRCSPPPPQTTTSISGRPCTDSTSCSEPSLGIKTPPPITGKGRAPEISADTKPVNFSSIASPPGRGAKPKTTCNDQGNDRGSSSEKKGGG